MHKHFYSHLVSIEELFEILETLEITLEERAELYQLAHSHTHHVIMDAILTELSEQDKERCLELLANDQNDLLWNHLNQKIELLEQKIKEAAQSARNDLHQDILELNVKE